jgi:pectin methylesterase-like acyl-CoA thioesterase
MNDVQVGQTSQIVRVALDGSGDFRTLEEAISSVLPDTVIHLAFGEYVLQSPLLIEKSITLVGEESENLKPTITCRKSECVMKFTGNGFFKVSYLNFLHSVYSILHKTTENEKITVDKSLELLNFDKLMSA